MAIFIFLTACHQKDHDKPTENNDSTPDTFTLKDVDVALIYESKIDGIPCLLHSVTDTLKNNENVGVIFAFDVDYDNPRKSNGCCAFEPGVGGSIRKIKNVNIKFVNDKSSLDVTDQLFNTNESQMRNQFEDYIQSQFQKDDYICICSEEKSGELIEYVNRKHLKKPYSEILDSTELSVLKNIEEFKSWYNHFTGLKYDGHFKEAGTGWRLSMYYFYFWIPVELKKSLKDYNSIEILIEFDDGKTLINRRKIINEV